MSISGSYGTHKIVTASGYTTEFMDASDKSSKQNKRLIVLKQLYGKSLLLY